MDTAGNSQPHQQSELDRPSQCNGHPVGGTPLLSKQSWQTCNILDNFNLLILLAFTLKNSLRKTHIFAPSACWQDCHRIVVKNSKMKCKGQDRQTEPRGPSHPKGPQFQELTLQQLHPPQLTPRSCLWSPPYSAAMCADDYETLPFFLKNNMEICLQDSNQLTKISGKPEQRERACWECLCKSDILPPR